MGLVRTSLVLRNPTKPDLAPIRVDALADTGALHLCIPEHVAIQLELQELEPRENTFADGRKGTAPTSGRSRSRSKTGGASSARWCSATNRYSVRFRWRTSISSSNRRRARLS